MTLFLKFLKFPMTRPRPKRNTMCWSIPATLYRNGCLMIPMWYFLSFGVHKRSVLVGRESGYRNVTALSIRVNDK
jgi:hypothetical protein